MEHATVEQAEVAARRIGRQARATMPAGWRFCVVLSRGGSSPATHVLHDMDDAETVRALRHVADSIESGRRGI